MRRRNPPPAAALASARLAVNRPHRKILKRRRTTLPQAPLLSDSSSEADSPIEAEADAASGSGGSSDEDPLVDLNDHRRRPAKIATTEDVEPEAPPEALLSGTESSADADSADADSADADSAGEDEPVLKFKRRKDEGCSAKEQLVSEECSEASCETELAESEDGENSSFVADLDLTSDEPPDSVAAEVEESEDRFEEVHLGPTPRASKRVAPPSSDDDDDDDESLMDESGFDAVPEGDLPAMRAQIDMLIDATRKHGNRDLIKGMSRADAVKRLERLLSRYFGFNEALCEYFLNLFGPEEALAFFKASTEPRPLTIRANSLKTRRRDLAKTLIARGADVDELAPWDKHGLLVNNSSIPIGATPEYLAGHYMLQSASSLLPVMALQPRPDEHILDMAAAPGGKSSHIAQLMRNTGCIVANDLKKERCFALAANLQRLGVRNAVVLNMDARKLHAFFNGRLFDRVLLDAPCSGTGVFSKDAAARVKRTPADFARLQSLQKELLCQAVDLCRPAKPGDTKSASGVIVYSTCSISVEENEGVIDYVLRHRRVELVDAELPFGTPGLTHFRGRRFSDKLKLTRRFYPHKNNMDGFFVAKLRKLAA